MISEKTLDYISWILLGITLLLLSVATEYLENLVSGKRIVFEMAGTGFLLASVWMYILYKTKRSYFEGEEQRASAVLSQFFSIIFLTIFISVYYNYSTGISNLYLKKVVVIEKSKNVLYGTTYATLFINNKRERFNPGEKEYIQLIPGDTIDIIAGKGDLNWEFIYRFNNDSAQLKN